MHGWTGFWTHERAGELRLEAEKQRLVRELRATRTEESGGRVPRLLRGLSMSIGVANLASRTALAADAGGGCDDAPGTARQPGMACDAPAR